MRVFRVKRDYGPDGKWIEHHPNPIVEVTASNPQEAAELVCGASLYDRGRKCRAQVWPLGGARNAHELSRFYSN